MGPVAKYRVEVYIDGAWKIVAVVTPKGKKWPGQQKTLPCVAVRTDLKRQVV
jgi:hypothetical protein